ncbi:2136_t:CDS:2 [Acaulospora colombiana]|uniref:2136_t:CDS:1 n=1 Tax=Acaulospora colombiana TaxID=27376 RepID=A0ACA9MKM8_9GLOM|nr:2136_t:CDS:2 [Acaulospora colombiana]
MITDILPVIDLELFLNEKNNPLTIKECQKAADALRNYGALLVKDPRVTEEDNSRFLDLMEDYFAQPLEVKLKDTRPELGYQMGLTPEFKEEPRCYRNPDCLDIIAQLSEDNRPLPITGPDVKWRFSWNIGKIPKETKFPQLNAESVIPEAFKDVWSTTMNKWGNQMHRAVIDISRMASVGLGLPVDTLADLTKNGPHLLAPTGSDLNVHGKLNTVLAVQAGKQLEWLTGGEVKAGYHEVVVTESTLRAIDDIKKTRPSRPLWRPFKPNAFYPPMLAGNQVKQELGQINLMES